MVRGTSQGCRYKIFSDIPVGSWYVRTKTEGREDWKNLRAQPLKIEALCPKPAQTRILTIEAGDL